MDIPPRNDPRWRALVLGDQSYALKGFATRVLLMRVRLMGLGADESCVEDAVTTAYDYFSKNLEPAQADLAEIFGAPPPFGV